MANSRKICDELATKRADTYLERIYDGYVPGYHASPPLHWSALVENDPQPEMMNDTQALEVEQPVQQTALQRFTASAASVFEKVGRFYDRHIVPSSMEGRMRQHFKENALGMTAGIIGSAAAVIATGPASFAFLAGAALTMYCANKMEVMKKKQDQPDLQHQAIPITNNTGQNNL